MILGFTTNQLAIVALVFVLGWLLGLLSRQSSRPIRRELREERARREAAERDLVAERERRPVASGTAASLGAAASGRRDDLSLIRGVGRVNETRLNEAGLHQYRDIEALSDADTRSLESRLELDEGIVARERWREQATLLRTDGADAHRLRFG